jgi:hypothetical protein
MAYYTKSEARNAAARAKQQSRRTGKLSSHILQEETRASNDHESFDVFLSHSSKDAELILGVKSILEEQGQKVYVDWIDDSQLDRTKVTSETADLLRRRMRQSNSLVWLATSSASESKWMPWELGYFDGFKPKQVAILPLVDASTDVFSGQEYLGLYPVIRTGRYADGRTDVFVENSREWATLRSFARGQAAFTRY